VLITGATGSFGSAFVEALLAAHSPDEVRVFSRDELKQSELRQRLGDDARASYVIGDVRDLPRLSRAMRGVDLVVHAAAMKQVPACEDNPFEAVQTNIIGAENVVSAAIENDVPVTVSLSTGKAVNPVNVYGATKLCAERIFTRANAYSRDSKARFASVRYGNVVNSRGSVTALFKAQAPTGIITITDERMTRFWITLPQVIAFVIEVLDRVGGGEVFIPKAPSMGILDVARALAPGAQHRAVGVRPGEALHETLMSEDDSAHALELDNAYVILPERPSWTMREVAGGRRVPPGFRYSSEVNDWWLDAEGLMQMVDGVPAAH
jgi:UDP-N-acetylglucosamine 4,6-dehydratase/5-epimerase